MPAPSILAILNRVETAPAVLQAANAMARAYPGATVDLLRPRPDMDPDFTPTEEVMSPERQAGFEAAQETLTAWLAKLAAEAGEMPFPHEVRGTVRKVVAERATQAGLAVAGTRCGGSRPAGRPRPLAAAAGAGSRAIRLALFASLDDGWSGA